MPRRQRRRVLRVSHLEDRTVPTGDLRVEAFADANANALWDTGEAGVAGLVFNHSGGGGADD